MVKAGDLKEIVTIKAATVTRDAYNQEKFAWNQTVGTAWAKVTVLNAREPIIADRPMMVASYEIELRSEVAVTRANRLEWKGKQLQIETITPNVANATNILACLEVTL